MKKKKLKELKKTMRSIQVEWLRTLLPEEDRKQINVNNISKYLSDQTHTFIDGQLELSFMSDKWVLKKLKRNPEIKTYNELMDYIKLTNVRRDTWTTI
jgi:hypothetical protein|tara:strand:- start:285 stop:578 length:294 start_codon:yes stop_codon:yes gene_type:complete